MDLILEYVKKLHPNLQFTAEEQANGQIPFFDMKIKQELKNFETEWYNKPSHTGVLLNFRARCPGRYKGNIVEGLVHRIFCATSSWEAFKKGLDEAMLILERNQYPPVLYQPIIRTTLEKILGSSEGRCERKGEKLAKGSRLMFFM